ncbi:MAG: hypothetical protein R2716_13400 [Microthrixaceae bacterium]
MTLAGHDASTLLRVVPAALVASLAELVVSLFVGRPRVATDIAATYLWVLTHPLEIRRARRRRAAFRHTSERDWTALQRRGSNRMRMLGVEASEENRLLAASRTSRERIRAATREVSSSRLDRVAVAVPVLILFGARQLWFGVLPSMRVHHPRGLNRRPAERVVDGLAFGRGGEPSLPGCGAGTRAAGHGARALRGSSPAPRDPRAPAHRPPRGLEAVPPGHEHQGAGGRGGGLRALAGGPQRRR